MKFTDPLTEANFNAWTYHKLRLRGINTIGELIRTGPRKLTKDYRINATNYKEVHTFLKAYEDGIIHIEKPFFKIEETQTLHYPRPREELANIALSELNLSVRTYHTLARSGYDTVEDLFSLTLESMRQIKHLGKRGQMEILVKIDGLSKTVDHKGFLSSTKKNDPCKLFVEKISQHLPVNPFNLYAELSDDFDRYCEKDLFVPTIREALKIEILNFIDKASVNFIDESSSVTFIDVIAFFPEGLIPIEILDSVFNELINDEQLQLIGERYAVKRITIYEFLERGTPLTKNGKPFPPRLLSILNQHLEGENITEIAAKRSLSKARIGQLLDNAFRKLSRRTIPFREDQYLDIFDQYYFSWEHFSHIFQENQVVYRFLIFNFKKKEEKKPLPLEIFIKDETVSQELRERAKVLVYKNHIEILPDQYIKKSINSILAHILPLHFQTDRHQNELFKIYLRFLEIFNLETEEDLLINKRAFDGRLSHSKLVLNKQKRMIRYFDIENFDFESFWRELNFRQYPKGTYSTIDIFSQHSELMTRYDIRDGDELHSLLRKVFSKKKITIIEFKRMPTIELVDEKFLSK